MEKQKILFDSTLDQSILDEFIRSLGHRNLAQYRGRIWESVMKQESLYLGTDMGSEGTSTLVYNGDRIKEVLNMFEVRNYRDLIGKEVTIYSDPRIRFGKTLGISKQIKREWSIPQGYVHLGIG